MEAVCCFSVVGVPLSEAGLVALLDGARLAVLEGFEKVIVQTVNLELLEVRPTERYGSLGAFSGPIFTAQVYGLTGMKTIVEYLVLQNELPIPRADLPPPGTVFN